MVFENYEEFLKRDDKKINGVSQEFATQHPDFEDDNETNEGCWNGRSCSDCSHKKNEIARFGQGNQNDAN